MQLIIANCNCFHSNPHATSGASPVCLQSYNNLATFGPNSYLQIRKSHDLYNLSNCKWSLLIKTFLRTVEDFDGGTSFSFSLRFRTSSCSGLLLYSHSLLFPDHLLVELLNGTVSTPSHTHTYTHTCMCAHTIITTIFQKSTCRYYTFWVS